MFGPPGLKGADLAGYTALPEAHGDEQAADVVDAFCGSVRELLPAHGAEQVKSIGDAVMLRVDKADAAVGLGLLVAQEIMSKHGSPAVRVGMHTGPAVERSGDWFGTSVNLAARIAALAGGGEVLLTAATRAQAGDAKGVHFDPRGRRELRNVTQPVEVFAAIRSGAASAGGLPIDPVCRMAVDPQHSAGRLSQRGVEYHFCSLECAARFASAPDAYALDPGEGPPSAG